MLFVLYFKLSKTSKEQIAGCFTTIILFLNFTDISFSVSVLSLWVANLIYKETFVLFEKYWRSSVVCYLNYFLISNFTFLYPALLLFLSFCRFQVVKKPLDASAKDQTYISSGLAHISVASISLSLLISGATKVFSPKGEIPFFLCSPFVDPTKILVIVQISTWLSSIIASFASIVIVVFHVKLYFALKESLASISKSVSKQRSTKPLVIQLFVVSLSNFFCWIPTFATYLACLYLDQYPTKMLVWVHVAFTPINSLVNPVVCIVSKLRSINQ